jgi:flavin-binding protein dodecin
MATATEHLKTPAAVQVVEMVGVSTENWSDAARQVVERASKTYQLITGLDVLHTTAVIRDGKIVEYHIDVKLAYITDRGCIG